MPRAWELLLGALLAMKAVPLTQSRIIREVLALIGIGLVLISVDLPPGHWSFPGYIALLPCVGTSLVIYAGEIGPSFVSRILSLRPVVFIGVISYSLYLWHWPLIVFSQRSPLNFDESGQVVFVVLFSVLAAFLSFEFIERPFRGSTSRFTRRQVFAFGFAASALVALSGRITYRTGGLPQRFSSHTLALIAGNSARTSDFYSSCSNWRTDVRGIGDINFCHLGDQYAHKIMFWGDSHVEQLYPAIHDLYSRGDLLDRGVVVAVGSGCLPDQNLNTNGRGYHCDAFAKYAKERAQWKDVDLIFIGFSTKIIRREDATCLSLDGKCVTVLSRAALERRLLEDLADEVHLFKSTGKAVIVGLPFPIYNKPIPDVGISNAMLTRFGMRLRPIDITSPSLREQIRATAISAGADIFDPRLSLCPDNQCITQVEGVSIYKDDSHLAASQVNILENSLRIVLQHNLFSTAGRTENPTFRK